jgi:hypothetical protein
MNAVKAENARLRATLANCFTDHFALAVIDPEKYAERRLTYINESVTDALAEGAV